MERHTVHTTQMTMVVADHLQTNGLYYNDNRLVLFDPVCSQHQAPVLDSGSS